MQYQKLGNTNINASVITLGTWGIGGAGWGKTDYEQCEKAVNKAIELDFWDMSLGVIDKI